MVDGGGKTTNDDSGPASRVGTTYMVSACASSTGATQHHGDSTDGMPHGGQALNNAGADSRHGDSAEHIRVHKTDVWHMQ